MRRPSILTLHADIVSSFDQKILQGFSRMPHVGCATCHHIGGTMRLHFASWIGVGAIALAGCGSLETFTKSKRLDNTHQNTLQRHPAIGTIDDVGSPHTDSPTNVVKSTITDLLSILANDALNQPGQSGERRRLIEDIIRHRVSYEEVSQRALGRPWKQLNHTEQQEFVSLFIQLLRDTLATKIDQYDDEQIVYLSERNNGGFAEVRTNLIGAKVDTTLNFRLGRQSGEWLIYDVIIDGASVVRNYQAQFNRIIRDDSYEGLVRRMKQRDLVVKVFERTAPPVTVNTSASP